MSYRKHGRILLKCDVKVEHEALGEVLAETQDISETGILIKCKALVGRISVGEALKAKMCPDAKCDPPSLFTVVRLTDDGLALTYI